jgi:hypothetical protein
MFEQYNLLQKLLRILIFVGLISIILLYVPTTELQKEDVIKIVSAISIVFIVYDFYYPSVKIELKKEEMETN